MRFRDDIDLDKTWLVSDTHFGHDNIVGFCFRPEDHEQVMIAEWRKVVPEDATVLHLGDLAYSNNARFRRIMAKELPPYTDENAPKPHKGRKLLIEGNHDQQRRAFYRSSGFTFVSPFKLGVSQEGDRLYVPELAWYKDDQNRKQYVEPMTTWRVSFSHYPWNPVHDGLQGPWDIRVHGHIHNNGYSREEFVPFLKNHINISVEQMKYRPVNLRVLLEAALLGRYKQTTEESLAEARARRGTR